MDLQQFVGECALHLSEKDYATLTKLMANDPDIQAAAEGPFARVWLSRSRQLLFTLARRRAARWSTQAPEMTNDLADFSADIERRTEDAAQTANPFEREKALDAMLWHELDELEISQPFSNKTVFAYGLKLKMVQRRAAMTEPAGKERLQELLEITPGNEKQNDE